VKVYLCAAWKRQKQLRGYRELLAAAGVEVTSRWLDQDGPPPMTQEDECAAALMDLRDLDRADEVIAFTEEPDAGYLTGGRHVEVGYALALGKPIRLVGRAENVFHAHPLVHHAARFETVLLEYARRVDAA